jgi:nucleoside-diphosphate-sugar epimerase
LRYFNVYGPRQDPDSPYAAVIPLFFKAAFSGRPATIHGDGEQTRDFTYVVDVVAANLAAMAAALDNEMAPLFNIAAGGRTSINELWRTVCDIVHFECPADYEPPRPGDVRDSMADIGRAKKVLGYAPRFTLREGLAAAAEHYRAG